jgi:hypothetical protein
VSRSAWHAGDAIHLANERANLREVCLSPIRICHHIAPAQNLRIPAKAATYSNLIAATIPI